MSLLNIEPARACDRDYVFDSWMRSYRDSPRTHKLEQEVYDDHMQARIERLLARSIVLVARPDDWPEGILGWACVEPGDGTMTIHYGYTKNRLRGQGIFWTLVHHAQGSNSAATDPSVERYFTHLRPPFSNTLIKNGYVHAPERAGRKPV